MSSEDGAEPGERDEIVLDEAAVYVAKIGLDGNVRYLSAPLREALGYGWWAARPLPSAMLRHEEMPNGALVQVQEDLGAGREAALVLVLRAADGTPCWLQAQVTPLRDLRGEVDGAHVTMRAPAARAIRAVRPIYAAMRAAERAEVARLHGSLPPDEIEEREAEAGWAQLDGLLRAWGQSYGELFWSLVNATFEEPETVVRRDVRGRPVRSLPVGARPRRPLLG